MPDMDGFELADVIRQHPRFQKTAIIFISGVHLTDSDRIQGYRSGAVDYISVPVVPESCAQRSASLRSCTGRRAHAGIAESGPGSKWLKSGPKNCGERRRIQKARRAA